MTDKILYFVVFALFIFVFWVSIKSYAILWAKNIVYKKKENLIKLLTKRHNLVPLLISVSEKYDNKNENLRNELILTREKAIKEKEFNAEKIIIESELSLKIKEYLENYNNLKNGNFFEIIHKLQDISDLIEKESNNYSKLVMDYNNELRKKSLMVSVKILKLQRENIFDFEK